MKVSKGFVFEATQEGDNKGWDLWEAVGVIVVVWIRMIIVIKVDEGHEELHRIGYSETLKCCIRAESTASAI